MRDFAFIQTAPGRVFVGWGPFEQLPFRRPGRPAFFLTDFFLDESQPWRHPAEWEEVALEDLAARFDDKARPETAWTPIDPGSFARLFESAQGGITRGDFKKIVPVIFEHGYLSSPPEWGHFFRCLATVPQGLWAYGYSIDRRSVAGATPEFLFQSHGHGYKTMALAGTRPMARADELLHDSKELHEHRFVVDDIVRRLAPFGNVEVGVLGIMSLPGIAHLVTPIFFIERGDERMTFGEMIRRLHPTAALGVWPRNEAGERWLRESDAGVERRGFGAPFGFERESFNIALVSIRNVEWSGLELRIGSGAGVLAESRLEAEFEELRYKRDQVKGLFGIRSAAEVSS